MRPSGQGLSGLSNVGWLLAALLALLVGVWLVAQQAVGWQWFQ